MLKPTWMFMDSLDSIRKQTYKCAQCKLNIVYETWQQNIKVKIKKKIIFFLEGGGGGVHAVVLVKTFPFMYQLLTTVGLILTKLEWFLFSGYGQTDTISESSHRNMLEHKKFQLKAQN